VRIHFRRGNFTHYLCVVVLRTAVLDCRASATSKLYLHHLGVTHVVNAAEGNMPGMVDTGAHYYADFGIVYMGLPILDEPFYNIFQHFNAAAEFIERGIKYGGETEAVISANAFHLRVLKGLWMVGFFSFAGKVLIHCMKGKSRSAALAVAYLMLKVGMPVSMALQQCCRNRAIHPNEGFLHQLIHLDECLRNGIAPSTL